MWRNTVGAMLALVCAMAVAGPAQAGGGGFFRKGEVRKEFQQVIAVSQAAPFDAADRTLRIYLSDKPIDIARLRGKLDLSNSANEALDEVDGSMVEITLHGEDGPQMWFSANEPSDTFNTSGSGEFTTTRRDDARIEGFWKTAKPEDFFDETFEFDLKFATDIVNVDLKGKPTAADGGEAGAAWLAKVKAIASKDVDWVRQDLGDAAEWLLPKDDPGAIDSYFDMQHYSIPKQCQVTAGLALEDGVLLRVEGENYDGQKVTGTVLMAREDGRWNHQSSNLSIQW